MLKSIIVVLNFLLMWSVAHAGDIQNLRGQRYCEIILAPSLLARKMQVYNTIGLNQCPETLWSKITVDEIRKETGARFVHLNGPRYWMIDGMQNTELLSSKIRTFANLQMREAGAIQVGVEDKWRSSTAYRKRLVHRHTTWVYNAGKPVYELINPKGEIFVMQSYSVQKISQTPQSLEGLATKLKLPPDWKFRARVLKQDAYLSSVNDIAVVIQDDFLNTYQQAPSGW